MKQIKKRKGFSLAELMVTLAMLGILLTISFPSIRAYMDSVRLKEATYNHQTIVYSVRMWSINNEDKNIIPGSFSALNSQGESVASYLRTYNPDFFRKYLENSSFQTMTIHEVGSMRLGATYELRGGRLMTDVFTRNNDQIIFDALSGIVDATARTKYIVE